MASTAALCSFVAYLTASISAGAVETSGFPLVVTVGGGCLLAVGLLTGNGLALSMAFLGQVVGDIGGMEAGGVGLGRAALAGVLVLVSMEATRVSIDARRPSRFDGTVLRRLVRRMVLVSGCAVIAAAVLAAVSGVGTPDALVTLGLAVGVALVAGLGGVGRLRGAMAARLAAGVLATAVVVGLAGLAATGSGGIGSESTAEPEVEVVAQPPVTGDATADEPVEEADVGAELLVRLVVFGMLVLVALLVGGALLLPQAELDLEPVEAEPTDPMLVMHGSPIDVDEVSEDVVSDAIAVLEGALAELGAEADPGRAVRLAYAQAQTGFGHLEGRGPTESEMEFLTRILLRLGVSAPAMRELTDLFTEARFSAHRIDEAMRDRAVSAVMAVRADLVATSAATETGARG